MKIEETVKAVDLISERIEAINAKARESNEDLASLEDAIKGINGLFAEVRKEINDLGSYLEQIGTVTGLINRIADQTNMLALNASIEAARAGESGKGFAIVAEEIRKLAEQSRASASNINDLLRNVQMKSSSVIQTSDSMERELSGQITVIGGSIQSFKGIIADVQEIIPRILAVSNNMEEIEREKGTITQSIEATAAVAEEVSASSEQIAASAEQLNACSEEVASLTKDLNVVAHNMVREVERFRIS